MSTVRSLCILRTGAMLLCTVVVLLVGAAYRGDGSETRTRWIGSWAASQQLVEPGNALAPEDSAMLPCAKSCIYLSAVAEFACGFRIGLALSRCS